ncbi:MAG: hypothetical protein WCX79_03735 [Candidatus Paceibacterota bacterium]|jgi:hypothetical protein
MTIVEWAGYLNNREYSSVLSPNEAKDATKDGVIIAWVPRNGNICLKGTSNIEMMIHGGEKGDRLWLRRLNSPDHYEDVYLRIFKINEAWLVDCDQPYEEFSLFDDGILCCVGIVFLWEPTTPSSLKVPE